MPGILSVFPTWSMKTVLGLEPTSVHSHTETYTEIYNHRLTDMTSHPGTQCPPPLPVSHRVGVFHTQCGNAATIITAAAIIIANIVIRYCSPHMCLIPSATLRRKAVVSLSPFYR